MPSASDGIVEHEPGDLTCVAGAGMRLGALQEALRRHGQRLSLDPPGDPTLEECVLEDLSGPLRHRFGTMRDLVIGITVTLPDGTRASAGGKVVKNVAGYDLGKLFCGSRGRLGRVEQLALRLHPLPAASRSLTTGAARWPELHRSGLVPSAVDIAGEAMHVLFEGAPRAVDAQASALGGDESDPWNDVRALQARLRGRRGWDGGVAPLVRPGPRIAYVEEPSHEPWSALAERVVEALCSPS
ncbi:MAG TPA: FAD-binding oxidoreductase [Gaiellaceae bacterium]|nr:FAD-binding oxidoreductase [Gaiellaceae bacterium]